jgi:hypothetical protein
MHSFESAAANRPEMTVYYTTNTGGSGGGVPDKITNQACVTAGFFSTLCVTQVVTIKIQSITTISISKSVSNISLEGTPITDALPGATVTYTINYSNITVDQGNYAIIYDRLSTNLIYSTNIISAPAGWNQEFSTNQIPDQTWNSTHYINSIPALKQNIKWVRWKKNIVAGHEAGIFTLKVIIK